MKLTIIRDGQVPFTMVPNSVICSDPRLSWKAKGIYTYLLSRPHGWEMRLTDLVNRSKDGRESTMAGLRELEGAGLITRIQSRDEAGRMGAATITVRIPISNESNELNPQTGFPSTVKPISDNTTHSNTDLRKIDLRKKDQERSIPIAADATSEQTSPASPTTKPDPLESYPKLLRAYQPLRDKLIAVHPKAKLPAIGSAGELKDRKAFADLARLDGYTEDEIIITIRWILRGETQQAAFWQQQFCSVAWLRKVRDGASRFTRSRASMEREDAPQKPKSLTAPEPEGASAYYERVQREQREQQARYEQERLDEYLRANPEAAQEVYQ